MSGPSGIEAALQRFAPVPGGYPLAVRVAGQKPVAEWYAELILPPGASVTAGPGTRVTVQKHGHRLTPVSSSGTVVYAAVGGTSSAPTHVRVWAKTGAGQGFVRVSGVFVTDRRGRSVKATDTTWPGSTAVKTDPGSWPSTDRDGAGFGGGFGFGGGGGGGGQHKNHANLHIEIDDTGRVRTIRHDVATDSDSGGGGGAGGGGGMGGGTNSGPEFAQAGQQQAAQGQQQGHQQQGQGQQGGGHEQGNPVTRLATAVADLTKRVDNLERKPA